MLFYFPFLPNVDMVFICVFWNGYHCAAHVHRITDVCLIKALHCTMYLCSTFTPGISSFNVLVQYICSRKLTDNSFVLCGKGLWNNISHSVRVSAC